MIEGMSFVDTDDDSIILPPSRIALGVEYMGAKYSGWQRQLSVDSIQKRVEYALAKILQQNVSISCAGRTDAGVHATAQVAHFDSPVARPIKAFTRGMNTILPKDIAITWAKPVGDDFHARFSATARRYRYVIYNSALRSGVFNAGVTHVYKSIDAGLMHEAAQVLVGKHDFTSYRASHCQSKTPCRLMHYIKVYRMQQFVIVDVKANAFLHHMVRNIVGSLLDVGSGEKPHSYIAEVLAIKDRAKASSTAKPNGLYLVEVDYDDRFALPKTHAGPLFLPDLK
jgi:tRNA pseudouridine38-40 synthase